MRAVVDDVLEFLAGFEIRNFLRRNFHAGACLGIAADTRLALPCAKAAKAANFDLIAGAQRAHDAVENSFYDDFAVFASELCESRHFFYQINFGPVSPYST